MSYADIYHIEYPLGDGVIAVGDIVVTSTNNTPQFEVIAVVDQKAWIRDCTHRSDFIIDRRRCRRLEDL